MDIRTRRIYDEPSRRDGRATLLYASKRTERNNATALKEYLEGRNDR